MATIAHLSDVHFGAHGTACIDTTTFETIFFVLWVIGGLPSALYLGGNFTMLMDKHPGAACWPCEEGKWAGRNPIFQPGFAMFPAIP